MGQEPSLEELRLGARIYSIAAALSAVGYAFARMPWTYLFAAIGVVCFVRSVVYFWQAKKESTSEARRHGEKTQGEKTEGHE